MVAVAESVAVRGYADLTVEDVIARAGVSRRTFYDQFANKHEAFLAAFDEVSAQLLANIALALKSTTEFAQSVERCLEAFLYYLAVEPAFAHMCIVDVLAAGQPAIERRNNVIRAFTELFDRASRALPEQPPALTSETVVGAIHGVVYSRIAADRTHELPSLLPDLLFSVLLPYLGQPAAEQARRDAAHRLAARPAAAAPRPGLTAAAARR